MSDSRAAYPKATGFYSPSRSYPEYPFNDIASVPNPVYDLIRESLRQAGLDSANFGTDRWNPLGDYIRPHSRVFVLCNFVYHRRWKETQTEFVSKCTHAAVIRAVIDYILIAVGTDTAVRFGNAPLQAGDWPFILELTGASAIVRYYERRGVEVLPMDLRLFAARRSLAGREVEIVRKDAATNAIDVTLTEVSRLTELDGNAFCAKPPFRVSEYDPRVIAEKHRDGRHSYVIAREILESDVIVSVSKLKTHEKVGITCGLKGFVGAVASKDCLAHHRFGGSGEGGDEYPGTSRMRRAAAGYHDWVQSLQYGSAWRNLNLVVDTNLRRAMRRLHLTQAGAWHGNDTCWRMALDLARIVHFADCRGVLEAARRRTSLSFIDGIVAAEGNGPLAPTPVEAGTVLFSDNVALGDYVAAQLMGFDPERIPLVREAMKPGAFSICDEAAIERAVLLWNGRALPLRAVPPVLKRAFLPPAGWRNWIERNYDHHPEIKRAALPK